MPLPDNVRQFVRSAKRDMRRLERRIEAITLTYGEEPSDQQVAKTLEALCEQWTNLRFAIANARTAARDGMMAH